MDACHRIKFRTWLGFLVIVISTISAANAHHPNPFASSNTATAAHISAYDLLNGIRFAGSFTDEDVAYLQNSLQFLYDNAPEWYLYIAQAKPFVLSIGQTDNQDWVAASATCCDDQGSGRITFDDHLGLLTTSPSSEDQTVPSRQVMFLSALIHEVTHLRDHRGGLVPMRIDAVACMLAEESAYAKELELTRFLTSATFAGNTSGADYRAAAQRQFDAQESLFNRQFWKFYCILAHPNIMDD